MIEVLVGLCVILGILGLIWGGGWLAAKKDNGYADFVDGCYYGLLGVLLLFMAGTFLYVFGIIAYVLGRAITGG